MKAPLEIIKKPVPRYFAQYVTKSGTIGRKGFSTRTLAARFAAKEWLLDQLYGPKVHRFNSSMEWGWYAREWDWDIERMKFVFNCQWIEENGVEKHRGSMWDEYNDPCDPIMCVEDGKAFCALGWTEEVKAIAGMLLKGEEPRLSWWVAERNAEYIQKPVRGEADTVVHRGGQQIHPEGTA